MNLRPSFHPNNSALFPQCRGRLKYGPLGFSRGLAESQGAWRTWAVRLTLLSSLCLFVIPLQAKAAESEDVANAPVGWVFRWLNFAIVFGAGGYLLVTRSRSTFQRRAEKIASAIAEKARIRKEAQARLHDAEEKLAGVDKEAAKLRAVALSEAQAEAERIRALAKEEIAKIERAAQAEVETAERLARSELKAFAARLVIERAEGVLREQMTPQADEAIFRFFVSGLTRSAN